MSISTILLVVFLFVAVRKSTQRQQRIAAMADFYRTRASRSIYLWELLPANLIPPPPFRPEDLE